MIVNTTVCPSLFFMMHTLFPRIYLRRTALILAFYPQILFMSPFFLIPTPLLFLGFWRIWPESIFYPHASLPTLKVLCVLEKCWMNINRAVFLLTKVTYEYVVRFINTSTLKYLIHTNDCCYCYCFMPFMCTDLQELFKNKSNTKSQYAKSLKSGWGWGGGMRFIKNHWHQLHVV